MCYDYWDKWLINILRILSNWLLFFSIDKLSYWNLWCIYKEDIRVHPLFIVIIPMLYELIQNTTTKRVKYIKKNNKDVRFLDIIGQEKYMGNKKKVKFTIAKKFVCEKRNIILICWLLFQCNNQWRIFLKRVADMNREALYRGNKQTKTTIINTSLRLKEKKNKQKKLDIWHKTINYNYCFLLFEQNCL